MLVIHFRVQYLAKKLKSLSQLLTVDARWKVADLNLE